jgi:ornithine cyclodeaminase/alanine dehydrogenase
LWAVSEARKIRQALVYDISAENAARFAKEMGGKLGIPIEVAQNAVEVLEADIVCTATTSATPLFDGAKIKPGTHINGIGSHMPKARELDTATIERSLLIADSREGCLAEAGDVIIPIAEGAITESHIHAELGEVVTGKMEGRTSTKQITLFKSVGLAIQDAAVAKLVYDKAREMGVGQEVEI